MKTAIIINSKEASAINDIMGSYGSNFRIKEINCTTHGITVSGSFDSEANYTLEVEVPVSMVLGLCQIALDHSRAIKGIITTIKGLKETLEYVARNVSRDIRNLMREYEKDE